MYATDDLEEKILRRIPLEILSGGVLLALATLPFFGPISALAVFAGGIVSALGFLWMKSTLTRILRSGPRPALRKAFLIYGLRLVLILVVFFDYNFVVSREDSGIRGRVFRPGACFF